MELIDPPSTNQTFPLLAFFRVVTRQGHAHRRASEGDRPHDCKLGTKYQPAPWADGIDDAEHEQSDCPFTADSPSEA